MSPSALNCLIISSTGSSTKSSNLSRMLIFDVSGGLHFISSTTRGKTLASLEARSIDNLFITYFSSLSSKLKLGKKRETPGGRDTLLNFVDGRQIGKLGTRI